MKLWTISFNATAAACSVFMVQTVIADSAASANWLPVEAGTYSITDEVNWEGGMVPTNSAATANFAPNGVVGDQQLDFPDIRNVEWHLGTVVGATNQTIRLPDRYSGGHTTYRDLHVKDPNAFAGTWTTRDAHSRIHLAPTESFVPTLATLSVTNAPFLHFASGTAAVERLVGGGTVGKRGAGGTLHIKGVNPNDQMRTDIRIEDTGGSVTLDYSDYPAEIPVREGIYVRFDAARPDTLDVVEENGRRYVTAWRDAEGGSVVAVPHTGKDIRNNVRNSRPWLSTATSIGGYPLVDFGAAENASDATQTTPETPEYGTLKDVFGPSASLEFPQATQVREVFLAWQDVQSTNAQPFVVGAKGYYHLHRQKKNGLFEYWTDQYHRNDETYVDGVRYKSTDYRSYDCTPMTVVSTSLSENPDPTVDAPQFVCLDTLAQDRNIRYGGVRIGEAIIYTNVLTSAQRISVHRYLQRKWANEKGGAFAVREVHTTADNQGVNVPAGRTASIGALDVPDFMTFVKDGGGTLNVDTVVREGMALTVNGGAVTFNRELSVPDDAAPADNPELWLDATVAGSLVASSMVHGIEGRSYIGRWNDRRATQTALCAMPMTGSADTNLPFVVANAVNGKAAVDFGDGCLPSSKNWDASNSDASRMRIVRIGQNGQANESNLKVCDAFAVWRMKNELSYYRRQYSSGNSLRTSIDPPPLFWANDLTYTRSGTECLMSWYTEREPPCAHWEIDGKRVSPQLDSFDFGTEEFHVVSFSANNALRMNRLADDRGLVYGGQQIAEVILYTRKLNEGERRRTIAYLMRKWRGETSPSARETISLSKVSFAPDVPIAFSGDRPVNVESLDIPDGGTLSWDGAGTLNVGLNDVLGKAFYHFDATDADSFITDVADNGDGTAKTNITEWLDVRRNGMSAKSVIENRSVAKPTLITVETRNGKTMPVVDFGEFNESTNPSAGTTAAGMAIFRNGSRMNAYHPNNIDQLVEEAHVVYCDAHEEKSRYGGRFVFSDVNYYPFHRGDNGSLFSAFRDGTYGDAVRNGYSAIDGEPVAYDYRLTNLQFHVISAAPTSAVPIRTIALDRNSRAGGCYQGELIAFKKRLNDAQRRFVQGYLAWKWFGEGERPVLTNSLSALRITNGGTISVPDTVALAVTELDVIGDCTVAAAVSDVSVLSFDIQDTTGYDRLTVNGQLTLAESGSVTLSVGADVREVGEYPLLSATKLSGGDPCGEGWTRTINNASRRSVSMVMRGNTMYLRVLPRGTVVILR